MKDLIQNRIMFLTKRLQSYGHTAQSHYNDCEACKSNAHCEEIHEIAREHTNDIIRIEELEKLVEHYPKWEAIK